MLRMWHMCSAWTFTIYQQFRTVENFQLTKSIGISFLPHITEKRMKYSITDVTTFIYNLTIWHRIKIATALHSTKLSLNLTYPWSQGSWDQHGAHLGPTGLRWVPCCLMNFAIWVCISDKSACDHVDLDGYSGTQNMAAGYTCQRWDSQYPHVHVTNVDSMFPADGSATGASNYCRNPDGNKWPWCYTLEPSIRYAFCKLLDIPCGKQ